jgi:hypothetical protein
MSEIGDAKAALLAAIMKNVGSGLTGYSQGGASFQMASTKDMIEGYKLLQSLEENEAAAINGGPAVTYAEVIA